MPPAHDRQPRWAGRYAGCVERLWTPWRRAFVEGSASTDANASGCFLCDNPRQHDDKKNLILLRDERVYVLLNLYPYNSGHLLVAPYAHTGNFASLESKTAADLIHVSQQAVAVLEQAYHPHAFNLGMNLGREAGAGVPDHLHVHIVPRWNGDTNFMSILGETRVLPEELAVTAERLRPVFERLS